MRTIPENEPMYGIDLGICRDDGHLGSALGILAAGALPPLLPAVVGAGATCALLAAGLGNLTGITLFAPVALLLLAGLASRHPHDGRSDWMVPPILRGTEYLYLLALGYGAGVAEPLVFVLIAAVVLRHRDVAHRARCGVAPPLWARRAALGWDGRMALAALGGVLGWAPFVYGALAGYVLVLLGAESAVSWCATPVTTATDRRRNEWGGVGASTT
ncbi:hypothetical protein FHX37_0260 [Haloactinospora alba]|uniref:DUF5941 domain-containing protein n=2 Tax=Haloactinospora alba TaxID=405555 RepID=A0A543NEW9_9ACTN|nr:hypothetical protein FHX37_0260 [Haloactinospora alba]